MSTQIAPGPVYGIPRPRSLAALFRSNAAQSSRGWVPAFAVSLAISLGLFWLMHSVIDASGVGPAKKENLPTIDFVRLKRDTEVTPNERRKPPPPPPPKAPPPPSKLSVVAEAPVGGAGIAVPTEVDLSAGTGDGGAGAGAATSNMFDSDVVPLQRVNPQYPNEARRAGITGWVEMDLTIATDGSVRAAKVVNAKPKGLFDAAAVTAALKWRFKAKVLDGKAVEFHALQKVQFDLNK